MKGAETMMRKKTIFCGLLILFVLLPFGSKAESSNDIGQLEQALKVKKDTAKVNVLNRLSWEYRRQDPEKALLYGVQALELSSQLNYAEGKALALKHLGVIYWVRGEYNLSEEKYQASFALFRKLENRQETGNLHNLFGLLRWNQGKYPEAVSHYKDARRIFKETGDLEGEAYVFNNLGIIYYELGNPDEALNQYLAAIEMYEKLKDQFALSNVYNNIGLIYSEQGNYEKALKYFQSSLKIDLESGNVAGESKSYTNIGVAYYRSGNLDRSEINHLKALQISAHIADKKGVSESLINLGEIHFKRKEFSRAEEKLQAALKMKTEIGEEQGRAIALIHLGKLRAEQKQYQQATTMLAEALLISQNIGSLQNQKEAAFQLSEIYEQSGKRDEAFKYYKLYVSISDSIQEHQAGNKLLSLQIEFETRKKEQQIELWKKESIIQTGKKQALTGGIILLALLSLVFISRQRLKHRKEKKIAELLIETQCVKQRALELEVRNMELEIEFNRKSLMAYTQKLIEKNAIVESLVAQMEESQGQSQDEKLAMVAQLTESRIVTEDDWKEFKKLYQAVYPHFMAKLEADHPGITQAELRLAALISLKLNSREIAAILGISNDSVKKARQRLRKKMEMEVEEDLDERMIALIG